MKIDVCDLSSRICNSSENFCILTLIVSSILLFCAKAFEDNQLLRVLHSGISKGEKYPENVRHFCFSLMYYSPKAYEVIRRTFSNHLPCVSTIRNWYYNSDIVAEPGLQEARLNVLKKIAHDYKEKNGSQLVCSLVFDEMNIRKQIFWSSDQLKSVGFVSNENASTEDAIAKQAFVILLNGLNVNFEFPLTYHFIDSLNHAKRKDLLFEAISAATNCGLHISNVTFDGLEANISMCKMLGADLDVLSNDFKPFFINPISGEKIYIIVDPSHMIKLVRNTLALKKVIYDETNRKIEWRYIEALYEYSKKNSYKVHKLTKKHMQWDKNIMNVRLAVETLSESVASSMQFMMEQKHPDFQGAEATIEFIRKMNTLFDIFNTKHATNQNLFKNALSSGNQRIVFDFLDSCSQYIKSLQLEETRITTDKKTKQKTEKPVRISLLSSRRKAGFRGFIIDMLSVKTMYKELVENSSVLKSLPTYYLLQDVIELFFGKIRACCGFNNNPNVNQFKGAYRKLLSNMKILSPEHSNCRIFDGDLPDNPLYSNIYFVSSHRSKMIKHIDEELYHQQKDDILKEAAELEQIESCDHLLDVTKDFSISHIASFIEKKIIECPRFYCDSCKNIFVENEKSSVIDFGGSKSKPCQSTFEICRNAEKFLKLHDVGKLNNQFDFKVLYCSIFRTMNLNALFCKSKFECEQTHKYDIIKCIVGEYVAIKASQLCREITHDGQPTLMRQYLNRLITFNGL